MLYAGDGNFVFGWLLEEDPVVAATKTKPALGRFELLHVSVAGAEITGGRFDDLLRGG
jgi:hypothetical protein